jgi:hypothetical protein
LSGAKFEEEKMPSIFDFGRIERSEIRRSAYASLLFVGVLTNPSEIRGGEDAKHLRLLKH